MSKPENISFPHAPHGWSIEAATQVASEEGIELTDDHWFVVHGLQEYFAKNDFHKARELTDALDELYHAKGGLKSLYRLFPKGPVAQGCRLAGITPPSGSVDQSFGSVM
jgi:tRNA 2-thiouridine synthesizing protein E